MHFTLAGIEVTLEVIMSLDFVEDAMLESSDLYDFAGARCVVYRSDKHTHLEDERR